jgi:proteasome lid subunit RPN8/RPN11
MLADARACDPFESCGLIAGRASGLPRGGSEAVQVISVTNVLHSRVRFRMDPVQQLKAFNQIEEQGLELLAIYHSHPDGPATPSATDVSEAAYPGVVHLIWSKSGERLGERLTEPVAEQWNCRGFLIAGGRVSEVAIRILSDTG